MEFVLTGLDIDEKAAWVRAQLEAALADAPPARSTWTLGPLPAADADTEEAASCLLRVHGPGPVARRRSASAFSGAAVELALASYPGFTLTAPPGRGTPYGVYRAGVRRPRARSQRRSCTCPTGRASRWRRPDGVVRGGRASPRRHSPHRCRPPTPQPRGVPLGTFVHARSGDKGGDANLGLWVAPRAAATDARRSASPGCSHLVTPGRVRAAAARRPRTSRSRCSRCPTSAGSTSWSTDCSARASPPRPASTRRPRALGEWLRSRHVDIPEELL